ncbi:hypothetical protein J4732_11610 [Serratia marcescens]|uniref:Uncharacterized protein n=1 Tax=Serratia marcescens TaxID=615 RepID=A0A939NK00_SERMA|nr:hypothetical protein [Serratia marcescens]
MADERTNSVMIAGDDRSREHAKERLTSWITRASPGQYPCYPLKYAKAQSSVEVLTGVSAGPAKREGRAPPPTWRC